MKLTVAPLKNPNKGTALLTSGSVVSCEAYPNEVYIVVFDNGNTHLINLSTGKAAGGDWAEGQQWFVREAELIVK